jgi:hypothetical protein
MDGPNPRPILICWTLTLNRYERSTRTLFSPRFKYGHKVVGTVARRDFPTSNLGRIAPTLVYLTNC